MLPICLLLFQNILTSPIYHSGSSHQSGSGSSHQSGLHFTTKTNENENEKQQYKCGDSCNILGYFMIILLSCCLLGLMYMILTIIYYECIRPTIIDCIKNLTIKKKPKTQIEKIKFKEIHNSECPICLEPILSKQKPYILLCKHALHVHCMNDFVNSKLYNNQCPMCREDISI